MSGPDNLQTANNSRSSDNNRTSFGKDKIIIVMGPTGSGKSTFIDYATEQNGNGVGNGLDPYTTGIRIVKCKHPNGDEDVVFVDTPGLVESTSDSEVFQLISQWLAQTMCGKGAAMHNVVFGTTMWKLVQEVDGARREQQLKDNYLAEAIQAGCEVKRFGDSKKSAWDLVDDLKGKPMFPPELSRQDRIVVLMGPTGAGKSTVGSFFWPSLSRVDNSQFIDYATKQNGSSVGHTLSSETSKINIVRCMHPNDNRPVIFVDTPGFDDTNRSDVEILSQIASWFAGVYKKKIPLAAIVYLHRISDNRMASSPLKNLKMFASMCGQKVMPNVVICTTMWTQVDEATGSRREEQLKRDFWAGMIDEGCKVARFKDSSQSVWEIVGKLATQESFTEISRELVDEKKTLNETAAGLKLNAELKKLFADQKKAIREMQEQVERYGDSVAVESLQKRKEDIEGQLTSVKEQIQKLRIPWRKRIANWFAGMTSARDRQIIILESKPELD
ncbi:hypothetical protein HWV62_39902 [Athelia sp. TMB]|nr:hypothetical protein HWV62_39902 [Athelia sp. TMB]